MALKLIFMGTPHFAVPTLKSIYESQHKILEVYTQPPRPSKRGQKINISPIHEYSQLIKVKVRHPDNLDDEFNHITKLNPDVVVVVAYGIIIPKKLINIQNIKFINIHASLLPKWRGAAPIQRAIMNSDKETGISIMKIAAKLDAGPVMLQSKIKISKGTNFNELSSELANLGSKMILESLDLIENKNAVFKAQNHQEATYAKKIKKSETKINWHEDARKIVAKINALYPNPGSWFDLGGLRIKPIKAIEVPLKGSPGEILDKNFTIACANNSIQIIELKKEGKKSMLSKEFLKGFDLKVGKNLNNYV